MKRAHSIRQMQREAWGPITAELQSLCATAAEERRKMRALRVEVEALTVGTSKLIAFFRALPPSAMQAD